MFDLTGIRNFWEKFVFVSIFLFFSIFLILIIGSLKERDKKYSTMSEKDMCIDRYKEYTQDRVPAKCLKYFITK